MYYIVQGVCLMLCLNIAKKKDIDYMFCQKYKHWDNCLVFFALWYYMFQCKP